MLVDAFQDDPVNASRDEIDEVIDKVDLNKDGVFDRVEVRAVVVEMMKKKNQNRFLKMAVIFSFGLLTLSIVGNIGACYVAVTLAKDIKIGNGHVLTATTDGAVVETQSYRELIDLTGEISEEDRDKGSSRLFTQPVDVDIDGHGRRKLKVCSTSDPIESKKFLGCFDKGGARALSSGAQTDLQHNVFGSKVTLSIKAGKRYTHNACDNTQNIELWDVVEYSIRDETPERGNYMFFSQREDNDDSCRKIDKLSLYSVSLKQECTTKESLGQSMIHVMKNLECRADKPQSDEISSKPDGPLGPPSIPPLLPPSTPPLLPPSMLPLLPPSMLPILPPSMPPSMPPSRPPSMPPSMPPSLQ